MKSSARRSRKRGFTLIETLVAIAIAAIGLLTIFELFPAGFAAGAKSQSRVVATSIAGDILAAYRRVLANPGDANFGNMCRLTQTYTEGLGSAKFSNNYTIFSGVTGDSQYYYKVWINEVTDPYQKYQSAISMTEGLANRPLDSNYALPNVVACRRITVFVRGPFASGGATSGGANDPAWTGGGTGTNQRRVSGAVEVKMATYVTNYNLASTVTAYQCGPGATDGSGHSIPINRIYLTDATVAGTSTPHNFTIFNPTRLTTEEKDDTGPPSVYKWSTLWNADGSAASVVTMSSGNQKLWGLNELKMDNIWIGNMHDYNYNWAGDPTGSSCSWNGESNKIVNIQKDTSSPAPLNGKYYLELLHPIRGYPSGVPANPWTSYAAGTNLYGICGVQVTP